MLRSICGVVTTLALASLAIPAYAQPGPEVLRRVEGVKIIKTSNPALPIFQADEEDCGINLLLCGEVVQSTLTTRDCKVESDGTFFDLWFFPGYRGDLVAAGAISENFSTLLGMYTPSPASLWDFDSAPAGEAVAVASFLPYTGVWGLSVGSQASGPSKTGNYFLLLSCGFSSKCKANPSTLCLGNGRYSVQVGYHNQFANRYGFGGAIVPGRSTESGYFYFGSDPSNVELMVKILDFGDAVKVFWGQLTNLEYKIVVTDLATDTSKTYLSPSSNCGGSDANAFPSRVAAEPLRAAACRSGKNTACLLKGRFEVEGTWRNQFNGTSGSMGASRVSDLTSAFFFGSPGNVELLVKVADLGNRIGLFYGAMSNLEYTLTVRDTLTGEVKTYTNPAGRYCGGQADLPK
jgi:hypothetical protein